jgi:hypothetical protein
MQQMEVSDGHWAIVRVKRLSKGHLQSKDLPTWIAFDRSRL